MNKTNLSTKQTTWCDKSRKEVAYPHTPRDCDTECIGTKGTMTNLSSSTECKCLCHCTDKNCRFHCSQCSPLHNAGQPDTTTQGDDSPVECKCCGHKIEDYDCPCFHEGWITGNSEPPLKEQEKWDTTTQGDELSGNPGKLGDNSTGCICLEDNKMTQALCPVHNKRDEQIQTKGESIHPEKDRYKPVEGESKEKHPTGDDSMKEQIDSLINNFIKKWIPEYYSHLVDNDENDGERLRESLYALFQSQQKPLNIGFLRQWINEDRITDSSKMVTNEEIEIMLGVEPDKTLERVRENIQNLKIKTPSHPAYRYYNVGVNDALEVLEAEQKGQE